MINEAAQWNASKYFKEMNKGVGNPTHNNNTNNNATNQNNQQCKTNNSNNNNNNYNNRDSDFQHLDNKARNISSINNNAGNPRHVPTTTTTTTTRCSDNIVSNATDCDRNFFNRITYTTCSFAESCVQPETKRQNAIAFRSIPNATSRVKTTIFQRTIKSRNGASAILDSSTFYRILFFSLQLSAALFTFTHNIGFALASNVIDELSSVESVDRNNGIDDKVLGHFTHTWAVHIPNGEENGLAESVARDHGFINRGKIFDDHFHFEHRKISKRSLTPAAEHQTRLDDDDRIHWAQQQRAKSRQKRDFIRLRPSRTSQRTVSLVDAVSLNDPKWSQMWYLNRGGGIDMNVIPAWKEGITGRGIVVTILDDGLESDHPDIEHNYDPLASYDVNSHDDDPMPHYDMTDSNRHGTRCAGEVAATANNSICAVGIAFGASVGGVRMLDGDVTDAVEARSLSLNPQHIDIYSASWGPDDDGKTVDGPGELASRAFIEGVMKGRRGKGSIFIWASGNGGRELDNCNCDGYTNSIWTLSISSATEDGHVPWYSEKCSSTLATTYSSGGQGEKQVVTTDLHHSCTVSHTGTSASAPLAAGIAALVLESNNNLTWRDLQHIVVRTAKPANLKDPTWSKNGVGRRISHSFGYGLMDAAAMVRAARNWKTVPEQQRCEINAPHVDKTIPPEGSITLQLAVKHCMSVNYLEHVQAKITLTSQRRGDIQLYLKSPAGTRVTLLTSRVHDNSRSGFNQWPFMSVHTWGESPHGNWQLEIHNQGRYKAQITQWDLLFYGTEVPAQPEDTVHLGSGKYDSYGGDMEHNDIEFDASGQWHNMQQIGESSVESHDRTSTACTKTTIDQRCLDCAPPTFLFDGRCLEECPRHTYVVISDFASNDELNHNAKQTNSDKQEPTAIDQEQLLSTDKRRRSNHRLVQATDTAKSHRRRCLMCDPSCYQCYGPLNSQCSTCYPGSQLRQQQQTNETFCNVFAERSTGVGSDNVDFKIINNLGQSPFAVAKFLFSVLGVLAIVIGFIMLTIYRGMLCNRNENRESNNVHYSYDRVALLEENEPEVDDGGEQHPKDEIVKAATKNEQNVQVLPRQILKFVNDNSESEEEVDLFIVK